MRANVTGSLKPKRRPRGRAALALLPGVFALMLAGVSGVAAAAPTPSPTPTATPAPCHHHHHSCTTPTPTPTATPTATPTPSPTNSGNNGGGGSGTPTPTATPAPTQTPAPTAKPTPVTVGSSGGSHSGGTGASGTTGTSATSTRPQTVVVPTPFAPLSNAVKAVTSGQGLDAARIPPVEALTPLSGLDFGNGLNLGPLLALIDMLGIGLLIYLVRTRWLAPEA